LVCGCVRQTSNKSDQAEDRLDKSGDRHPLPPTLFSSHFKWKWIRDALLETALVVRRPRRFAHASDGKQVVGQRLPIPCLVLGRQRYRRMHAVAVHGLPLVRECHLPGQCLNNLRAGRPCRPASANLSPFRRRRSVSQSKRSCFCYMLRGLMEDDGRKPAARTLLISQGDNRVH
jgi:hypothetical protein